MLEKLFGKKGKHEIKVIIKGMHCGHCEVHVQDNLRKLPGVKSVKASYKHCEAHIHGDELPSDEVIFDAIVGMGYKPKGIEHIR
ncbi:MAG: heavy metal-associated domain-containing protein [Tissierellia bacterium]|nr:heavy metal-associated domain-containing protein [Tissierellia bacterium]